MGTQAINVINEFYEVPKPCTPLFGGTAVTNLACGFNHTTYITDYTKIFCTGFNYYGQCGYSYKLYEMMGSYKEVDIDLNPREKIVQLAVGKAHNLVLTSESRVFFWGSVIQNQHPEFKEIFGGSLEYTGVVEMKPPLNEGEKIVRIKASINRSVLFTNQGRVFIAGGEDQTQYSKLLL